LPRSFDNCLMGMSDPKTSATVVIAIDGPAASGKSTVARALAGHLGYRFLNSGDLYRAMTWACLRRKIDCHDIGAVASAAGQTRIEVGCDGNEYFPLIDSEDPRAHLRKEQVNANVSPVSAVPAVRYIVSAAIRAHATGRQTVIEGRDIGSVVFPDTPHKFYLDASPEVRRQRRAAQGLHDSIEKRDKLDSSRANAPLKIASGAHVIDTSHLTLEGVVDKVAEILSKSGIRPA